VARVRGVQRITRDEPEALSRGRLRNKSLAMIDDVGEYDTESVLSTRNAYPDHIIRFEFSHCGERMYRGELPAPHFQPARQCRPGQTPDGKIEHWRMSSDDEALWSSPHKAGHYKARAQTITKAQL
jgi:hypothetical protein